MATFTCGFCQSTSSSSKSYPAGDDSVCAECAQEYVAPLFTAALKNESEYPVRWGRDKLDVNAYSTFLPDGFVNEWEKRIKEYAMPMDQRLYCKISIGDETCNSFLGSRAEEPCSGECADCKSSVCGRCGESVVPEHFEQHSCSETDRLKTQAEAEAQAFDGLKRGRDFQICPNSACARKFYLGDGCNSMLCPACHIHFCFICGAAAHHDSGHWREGSGCPRWNAPDNPQAMFDRVVAPQPNEGVVRQEDWQVLALEDDPDIDHDREDEMEGPEWAWEFDNNQGWGLRAQEATRLPVEMRVLLHNLRAAHQHDHFETMQDFAFALHLAIRAHFRPGFLAAMAGAPRDLMSALRFETHFMIGQDHINQVHAARPQGVRLQDFPSLWAALMHYQRLYRDLMQAGTLWRATAQDLYRGADLL